LAASEDPRRPQPLPPNIAEPKIPKIPRIAAAIMISTMERFLRKDFPWEVRVPKLLYLL
jgi:hypothetical protein